MYFYTVPLHLVCGHVLHKPKPISYINHDGSVNAIEISRGVMSDWPIDDQIK